MDETIRRALARGLTCDITTIGRKSGRPRRLEIWYFVVDNMVYITGTPGERDWYANLMADPTLIFHMKEGAHVDLPARAVPISDPDERRRIMGAIMRGNPWFATQPYDIEAWVNGSPLIGVIFEGIALHE
jgi:deazaflavin-dependent oxidoreductase (nitroreductase family)